MRPYNKSLIQTELEFDSVFGDLSCRYSHIHVNDEHSNHGGKDDNDHHLHSDSSGEEIVFKNNYVSKYKIAYFINKLPMLVQENEYLIDAMLEGEELEVFGTNAVKYLSMYHWQRFAKYPIWTIFILHCFYIVLQAIYINQYFQERVD